MSGILTVNPGTLMRASLHTTYATLEITSQGITADLFDVH
jgi:hypothetical protein